MKFGDILRKLIAERAITQKQLAARLNIAASTLSSYAQCMREPDFETLKVIAKYFGVSIDYLLGYSASRETPLSVSESELLRVFRLLPEDMQLMYLEQGKAIVRVNAKKDGASLPQEKNKVL